ncbi:MAG: alpha-amylase, partial [Desulfovibrio sp.]|nr:alpha-amylase [Desulfovibrio sp.]
MAAICLCITIHEPYDLRRYTIFDIGSQTPYENDDRSCNRILHTAQNCHLPLCDLLLKLINHYKGDFRLAISISGTACSCFAQYTPEVIDALKAMAATGCVEFIAEPDSHSLAFLYSKEEFAHQLKEHVHCIRTTLGKVCSTFRHPELLFSNELGELLSELNMHTVLTEAQPKVLGWRNENYVYASSAAPNLHMLLRNTQLSGDLSNRFTQKDWGEWPLTAEKFAHWCNLLTPTAECINIFTDSHIFGLRHPKESGIFQFLEALPEKILNNKDLEFLTPKQIIKKFPVRDSLDVPKEISWDDEGSDIRGWLSNEMQQDALKTLYALTSRIRALNDPTLLQDFKRLQTSENFHYMSTRWFSESRPDRPSPFSSPYDAYISFMNIVSDLTQRLEHCENASKTAKKNRSSRAKPHDEQKK